MRKIPTIAIVIVVSLLIVIPSVYLVLRQLQKSAVQRVDDPFLFIPSKPQLIFHLRKPSLLQDSYIRSGELAKDISGLFPGRDLDFILTVDSLLADHPDLLAFWQNAELVVSFHTVEGNPADAFFIQVTLPPHAIRNNPFKYLNDIVFADFQIDYFKDYEDIFVAEKSQRSDTWFSVRDNVVLFASHHSLIMNGHPDETPGDYMHEDLHLSALRNSAGRFADNVYVATSLLCHWLPDYQHSAFPLQISCDQMAGWHLWDVSYQAEEVFFTGVASKEKDEVQKFSANLQGQSPRVSAVKNYIPLSASAILHLYLDDTETFARNFHPWLEKADDNHAYHAHASRFYDVTGIYADSLRQLWSGEILWVETEHADSQNGILIVGVSDDELLSEHPGLELFLSSDLAASPSGFTLSEEPVFHLQMPGFFPALTGGMVKKDLRYVAFHDNYAFVADHPTHLNDYFQALRLNDSFSAGEENRLRKEYMQEGHNLYVYFSFSPENKSAVRGSATEQNHNTQSENNGVSLRSFSIQMFAGTGDLLFSNAIVLNRSEYEVGNPFVWEISLNAPLHSGPFKVFNHNDGFTEYIFQDENNNLYLADAEGSILWEKEISGPVVSDIFQVDIYKNDRYQYLFNTRNYLHLIDRNGDYVRGYPMRFPAPAAAGIAVFDYEHNKNYRVIFPSENRRIYNYNLRREQVAGWHYRPTESVINSPVQHVRMEGRDYLLTNDATGQVQILNRRGGVRIKPGQPVRALPLHPLYAFNPVGGEPHFLVPGPGGLIQQIYTNGNVFSFTPDSLDGEYAFLYDFLRNETEKDMIFFHRGTLNVYNIASRLLFSKALGRIADGRVDVWRTDGYGRYVTVVDAEQGRLFLLDHRGEMVKPFPVQGDTRFVLDRLGAGKFAVVAGYANSLRCYQINLSKIKADHIESF